jgi:putative transposase
LECIARGGTAIAERSERTAQDYPALPLARLWQRFQRWDVRDPGPGRISVRRGRSSCYGLRCKLSRRDLPEMFPIQGVEFTYETVRAKVAKRTPLLIVTLRRCRGAAARVGCSWYVDEPYIKVHGGWRYLYRPISGSSALVDRTLSENQAMEGSFVSPERSSVLHRRGKRLMDMTAVLAQCASGSGRRCDIVAVGTTTISLHRIIVGS